VYQKYIDLALSVVVSALLCLAWGIDAFAVAGIVFTWVWLGSVLTGVVAGLGANVLNDFLALLEMWKNKKKLEVKEKTIDVEFAEDWKSNERGS
jgi:hypothetical protein